MWFFFCFLTSKITGTVIQRFSNVPNLQGTQIFILMRHPLSRPALNWKAELRWPGPRRSGRKRKK